MIARSVCLFVMAIAMAGCTVKPVESHLEKDFTYPPGGDMMDIGPLWDGPGAIAFPEILSRHFKLRFSNFRYHEFFGRSGSQPPNHSPSLENYPEADEQVKALAHEIWQDCNGLHKTSSRLGSGRVYNGVALDRVLNDLELTGKEELIPGGLIGPVKIKVQKVVSLKTDE